jgi:hypothetical protein
MLGGPRRGPYTKRGWRLVRVTSKECREVGGVGEPQFAGDRCDRPIGVGEQPAGLEDEPATTACLGDSPTAAWVARLRVRRE